jgi:hypothetical protein
LHDANATRIREIDYRCADVGALAALRAKGFHFSARVWLAARAIIVPFPRLSQKNGLRKATPAILLTFD